MGSYGSGMIGCYIELPKKGIKKTIKVHGCTNEKCIVHANKSELKKDADFCSKCGTPTGKIEKTITVMLDEMDLKLPNGLRTSFDGLHIFEENSMKSIEVHYQNDSKSIDLDEAKSKLEEFAKKYDYYIERLQDQYDKSIKAAYGVIVQWS